MDERELIQEILEEDEPDVDCMPISSWIFPTKSWINPFSTGFPKNLRGNSFLEWWLEIPFGRGDRLIKGYVIGTTDRAEIAPERIKSIHAVSTDGVGVESRLIALAAWIRDYDGATMIQALKTVIPVRKKERPKEKKQVLLAVSEEEAGERLAFFAKETSDRPLPAPQCPSGGGKPSLGVGDDEAQYSARGDP